MKENVGIHRRVTGPRAPRQMGLLARTPQHGTGHRIHAQSALLEKVSDLFR